MLADLLPKVVVCREAFDDRLPARLFAEEIVSIAAAVDKRKREFATGRRCAREALAGLGLPALPLPSGPHREPRWPPGIVGSITHCDGYRAAVVARRADEVLALGIDAEPHQPLPPGLLQTITLPQEARWVGSHALADPSICWDRLLFSAKESVYKAWFPLAGRWLGFDEATVTFDRDRRTFTARLHPAEPLLLDGHQLDVLHGRWLATPGLMLTAITLRTPRPSS